MVSRFEMRLGAWILRGACLLALGAPLLCAGCADRACFEWSEKEGACPAQEDALPFFQDSNCHFSEVQSVESEADFVNDACCYTVVNWDKNEERVLTCQ